MRRLRFGSVIAAVAIATAGAIPLFAAPAGATNACGAPGGEFPMTPGAQSAWKVDCSTNALTKVDNLAAADAPDAFWHRGTARTVAITATASSQTITYASGAIAAGDIGRPISGGCLAATAFIETAGLTSGTVSTSQPATGCGAATATIEYTRSRVLANASCTTGGILTTPAGTKSGLFASTDVNKSVSGGPFPANAKITVFTSANQVTVAPAPASACTAGQLITLGAATYLSGVPVWNTDPMGVDMSNSTANGQAFSCAVVAAHAVFTQTAAAIAMGQNFSASYTNLQVIATGTSTVTTVVNSATATALTTAAAACPTGVTATAGTLDIGQPGGDAPQTGNTTATLGAEINLNPSLVKTQDNCNLNTFEGFEIAGTWMNPGFYAGGAVIGNPTLVSVGQIAYPTSLIAFAAYVRPQRTGDSLQAAAHFEFVFPSLPTTLAVCLTVPHTGVPTNATQLSFGILPTPLFTGIGVATGSGNPADPGVRALGPQTGAQTGHYILKNGATTVATGALPTCTITAATTTPPPITCGDG
jgi:hypothetical protein